MTITANETVLDTAVDVRFNPAGEPLAVRYEGLIWAVAGDPVHWLARDAGSDPTRPTAVERADLTSAEYWRISVQPSSRSTLRTFTLRRDHLASQWLLESITDV